MGEKHAPLELELLIGFACLFLNCELFFFLFLVAALFSCSALEFLWSFCIRFDLSIGCMFILLESLPIPLSLCLD